MHEPGTNTEDLRPHLPADETHITRYGNRALWWGIGLCAGGIVAALVAWILTEGSPRHLTPGGLVLLAIAGIGVEAVGSGLVVMSGQIRHGRHQRAMGQRVIAQMAQIAADVAKDRRRLDSVASQLHDLGALLEANFNAIYPVIAVATALPDRIGSLEQAMHERFQKVDDVIAKVPDYSQAVIDGIELGRTTGSSDLT